MQHSLRRSFGAFISAAAVALTVAFSFTPTPVLAANCCTCKDGIERPAGSATTDAQCDAICPTDQKPGSLKQCTGPGGTPGSPTPAAGSAGGKPVELENPIAGVCPKGTEGQKCVQLVIGNVIKAAMGIVGSLALLMMIYGGFLWLTSMGNSERVEKGKTVIIWSTLGLILIFAAYAITSYVVGKISGTG